MKKKKMLNLLTPELRTTYLGKGARQKATYLHMPHNLNTDALSDDIMNGASMYKSLENIVKESHSDYSLITAPTLEDGYRAIVYLNACIEELDDMSNNCFSNDPDSDIEYQLTDDTDFDDDDADPDDIEEVFAESFDRIPIVRMADVVNQENDMRPFSSFGNFGLEMSNSAPRKNPWWTDCTDGPICILSDKSVNTFGFYTQILEDIEINALNRFKNNAHVYLLIINPTIPKDDLTITKAVLEYTANRYDITATESEWTKYRTKIFTDLVSQYHFKLAADINPETLAEKLMGINPDTPSKAYDIVLKYLVAKTNITTLKLSDFENLGLAGLISREDLNRKKVFMNKLYGMESVKEQLENILNMHRYNANRIKNHLEPLPYHNTMLFIGAPGTAKTTAAKMLADRMFEEGFLPGNKFISVSGAQLKGAYVGQSCPRTASIIEQHDAILIDEAYSLTSTLNGEIDSYAQEVLATLAMKIEEHPEKLIIFAGYGGDKVSKSDNLMYKFLNANPGIKSRISTTVTFDSYDSNTMLKITRYIAAQNNLKISSACDKMIIDYFNTRIKSRDFGNGREARGFVEQCQVFLAGREAGKKELNPNKLSLITKADVTKTIDFLTDMNHQQQGVGGKIGY